MRRISSGQARQFGRSCWQVGWEAVKEAARDNLLHWAAAIAYYSALSFTPLVFVGVTVVSLFADAQWTVERLTTILHNWVPEGGGQLNELVQRATEARGQVGIISFGAFLFTGSRVFAALSRGIQVIYDLDHRESLVREIVVQIVMLLTIGVVFIAALLSGFLFQIVWDAVQILPAGESLAHRVIAGGVQIVLLFVAFWLVYRFVPRERRDAGSALAGAIVATLAFVLVRPVFIFYLNRFSGNQQALYGSLASLVLVLVWVWITAIIILLGAEVAVVTRKRTGGANIDELVDQVAGI